jgi:hypothetical protein
MRMRVRRRNAARFDGLEGVEMGGDWIRVGVGSPFCFSFFEARIGIWLGTGLSVKLSDALGRGH